MIDLFISPGLRLHKHIMTVILAMDPSVQLCPRHSHYCTDQTTFCTVGNHASHSFNEPAIRTGMKNCVAELASTFIAYLQGIGSELFRDDGIVPWGMIYLKESRP